MDGLSGFTFVVIALLIFTAVTAWKGVRIVSQGEEWVVERLGKYHTTLQPGLHIIIPYIDRVAYKVVTKDIILDVAQQEVITKDNAVILVNAIAFIKVTDTVRAVYGVQDFSEAIRNMIQTTLRSITAKHPTAYRLVTRSRCG
jgi:regulator of protease activity HflC (stomatin/prohibitin superfamily)